MKQAINLLGQKFGRLLVVEHTDHRGQKGEAVWKCLCDCGKERFVKSTALRCKEVVSCGCTRKEASTRRLRDMTGQRLGRLFVIRRASNTKFGQARWECLCDCGRTTIVNGQCLREGQTKSCGCLKTDAAKRNIKFAKAARNLPPGKAHFNAILQRYKDDAKRKGRCFTLSDDEFLAMTQRNCYYCGALPIPFGGVSRTVNGCFTGNGIDRLDNSIGYTVDNCVTACRDCNYAKRALSRDDFISLALRIAEVHRH